MTLQLPKKTFTVEQYYQLADVGIIGPDDKVELLEGEIFEMSPINSRHSGTVTLIVQKLYSVFSDKVTIASQNPIRLNNNSEPEPDIYIAKKGLYISAHPTPKDLFLIIEVSDSSLEKDQLVKADLYAKAGIPEYWIVDLQNNQLEIYREPKLNGYQFKRIISESNDVKCEAIEFTLRFEDFFPE